jgi:hypothetical protein
MTRTGGIKLETRGFDLIVGVSTDSCVSASAAVDEVDTEIAVVASGAVSEVDSEVGRCGKTGTEGPPTRSATMATEVHPIEAAAAVPASQVKKKITRLRTSQCRRRDPKQVLSAQTCAVNTFA